MGVVIMQGVPKIFGALRGHLCDSIAFLLHSLTAGLPEATVLSSKSPSVVLHGMQTFSN